MFISFHIQFFMPLPSPPWHFGDAATFEFLFHSSGVFAAPISNEWKPKDPSDSDTALLMARCRPTNRVPSKVSETTTTLKWLSSDFWPCEVFCTSRKVGEKTEFKRSSMRVWRGPLAFIIVVVIVEEKLREAWCGSCMKARAVGIIVLREANKTNAVAIVLIVFMPGLGSGSF